MNDLNLIFVGNSGVVNLGIVVVAYLLGSIPFGYLLVRFFLKDDVRKIGSGNIGATNVIRTGKKGLGIATLLLDLSKGYVAVVVASHWGAALGLNTKHAAVVAAVMATVGHVFPIWLKFKGGKGVATGLGVFLALAPLAACSALALFIVLVVLTRYVSVGSIAAAAMMPVFTWMMAPVMRTEWLIVGSSLVPLLIILKHEANIRRLIAGTENRFGSKKTAGKTNT